MELNAEFNLGIQSLIFPENKATDQNRFDNCEKYEHMGQTVAETSLIRLVLEIQWIPTIKKLV